MDVERLVMISTEPDPDFVEVTGPRNIMSQASLHHFTTNVSTTIREGKEKTMFRETERNTVSSCGESRQGNCGCRFRVSPARSKVLGNGRSCQGQKSENCLHIEMNWGWRLRDSER
jgi:hypothetical protein